MKAFIFDMDGVIIDSEPIHFDIDVKTMSYYGITITPVELEQFVGMTNPEMWHILKQKYNLSQPIEEIIDYQLSAKIERLKTIDIKPIDGIYELIVELKRNNISIGLASSSPTRFINAVLSKFNLTHLFDCIVSGEEVAKGKPEPDVYVEAANLLQVAPKDCVVLEDSKNGIRAAISAGMKCIGFINESSGHQDLSKADRIVASIREVNVKELYHLIS